MSPGAMTFAQGLPSAARARIRRTRRPSTSWSQPRIGCDGAFTRRSPGHGPGGAAHRQRPTFGIQLCKACMQDCAERCGRASGMCSYNCLMVRKISSAKGKPHLLPMNGNTCTRAEALREAIEDKIATGAFPPGMHLDECHLAQMFGVSRTPLREALIQLSSMGIVVVRPRRGAVVADVTPQRLL